METDVIDDGVFDSVAFVQLLVGLEWAFGVTVDLAALQLDDWRSISPIAQFVVRREERVNRHERVEPG